MINPQKTYQHQRELWKTKKDVQTAPAKLKSDPLPSRIYDQKEFINNITYRAQENP